MAKDMDLSGLNRKELIALQGDIQRELQRREKQDRDEAYQKIRAIAEEAGIPLQELVSSPQQRGRGRSKVAAKYRDPENPENTWAGRGRKPRWLENALSKGRKMEDFAV